MEECSLIPIYVNPRSQKMLKTCRRRRCKVTHYIKTTQFKGRALRYFILCGKRNTNPFDVICTIMVAYIGRTECRLLSFKPLFSFTIFKCLWGHSHHCQAPKKRRRKKRRTSRSLRPNVKSGQELQTHKPIWNFIEFSMLFDITIDSWIHVSSFISSVFLYQNSHFQLYDQNLFLQQTQYGLE